MATKNMDTKIAKQSRTHRPVPVRRSMVGLDRAVSNLFSGYSDFNGFAQRSEFWFSRLFLWSIDLALLMFAFASEIGLGMFIAWYAFTLVPRMAQYSRRFNDAAFSRIWYLVPMLVHVGLTSLFLAVFGIFMLYSNNGPMLFLLGVYYVEFVLLPILGFQIFNIIVVCRPSKR